MSENLLSCGPFTGCDEATLRATLGRLGLSATDDGTPPRLLPDTGGGLRLEARGPAVRGYFLAEDGEEAELQDIKRLVLACCGAGREIRFSGSATVGAGRLLVVSARASHDGRVVRWSETRSVIGPAGRAVTVRDPGA